MFVHIFLWPSAGRGWTQKPRPVLLVLNMLLSERLDSLHDIHRCHGGIIDKAAEAHAVYTVVLFLDLSPLCSGQTCCKRMSHRGRPSGFSDPFHIQTTMSCPTTSCFWRWDLQVQSIPSLHSDVKMMTFSARQLDGRARLTPEVQVIPLKSRTVGPASRCITAGWGDIGDNRTIANRLQEVDVTILAQRTCRQRWGNVRVLRSMVCGVGARSFQGFCSVRGTRSWCEHCGFIEASFNSSTGWDVCL